MKLSEIFESASRLSLYLTLALAMILVILLIMSPFYLNKIFLWHILVLAIIISFIHWTYRINKANKARASKQKQVISESRGTRFPCISILIPAWNEENIIYECVNHVLNSSYPNFEVIIIAGGADKTFEYASALSKMNEEVKAVKQDHRGKNAALNKGLKYANGESIVILDADTFVEKDWLKHLVTPIIDGNAVATTGNYNPNSTLNWVLSIYCMLKIISKYINNAAGFYGGSIAILRKKLEQLGRFDENVLTTDYYLHSQLRIDPIKFVQNAKTKTDMPNKFIQFLKVETRWKRNLLSTNLLKTPILSLSLIFNGQKHIKNYYSFIDSTIFVIGFLFCLFYYFLGNMLMSILIFKDLWIFYFSLNILFTMSKSIEVYVYTNNKIWLRYFWVPPITMVLEYLITFYASLTYYKASFHFKGPRKL